MQANEIPSTSKLDSNHVYVEPEDSVFVETCFNGGTDMQIMDVTSQMNRATEARHAPVVKQRSPRSPRRSRSFNFCIYGVTLLIPGVAMIIVYFFLFGNPSRTGQWSPSDAFVITGAVLVALSAVAIIVGFYQYCTSQMEERRRRMRDLSNREPPSYSKIAKISKPSTSCKNNFETPPSFESCIVEKDTYRETHHGAINEAFDNDEPPPLYQIELQPSTSTVGASN